MIVTLGEDLVIRLCYYFLYDCHGAGMHGLIFRESFDTVVLILIEMLCRLTNCCYNCALNLLPCLSTLCSQLMIA